MKVEISVAIEELKHQFHLSTFNIREDEQGGAYVIMEPLEISEKFQPNETWVGFQIPAQYPYADIYPIFIGGDVKRVDGRAFEAPVTNGHSFEGRTAIQVSRRSSATQNGMQKATSKILKVLDFLEKLQ